MGMATAQSLLRVAAAQPGDFERSADNGTLHKKTSFFSFDTPCFHAKLPAKSAPCCNLGQSGLRTSDASDKIAKSAQLWQEFFSDPSQWWDNRFTKLSSRSPDFKHKITVEALWIDSWWNPPWVKEKIANLAFDQVQSGSKSTSRALTSFGDYGKIQKLSEEGRLKEAVHLLEILTHQTSLAPKAAFICLLRGCRRRKALAEGKQVHVLIAQTKYSRDIFLSNLLVDMYSNCGSVAEALKVFAMMPKRNVFSWTAMISAYINSGQYKEAINLHDQMKHEGVEPDDITLSLLLKACARIPSLEQGKQLHSLIIEKGIESNRIIQTTLIDMYAKCGCLNDAREVFDNMHQRDVVSWSAMMAGYAQKGLSKEALDLYDQMNHEGVEPDTITLCLLLKLCGSISAVERGKQLHSLVLKKGFESERVIQSTLVDMYSKCGCLKDARELFNNMARGNIACWNAMIAGYSQKGLGKDALDLYEQMKLEGVEPDSITLALLLKACASISALEQGKQLHSLILDKCFEADTIIQTALLDMYAKCGCLNDAREVFDNMPQRDVVSWNAMIAGYAQKGLGNEALDLYEQMKDEGVEPDLITLGLLLKACASISALERGKQLHSLILVKGFESDTFIQTTLVDMYAKCGCLKDARELFNNMPQRDVVSWSAIIAGYAQKGLAKEALDLYQQMKDEGFPANELTYTCVLSACSHSCLVEEGRHIFESMLKDHGVTPTLEHYTCMVDLLGRAGLMADAEDFVRKMPFQPDKVMWMSLLGAARKHDNVEIGRRAFEHVMEMRPEEDAAPYLLLLDIYVASGRMDEAAHLTMHRGFEINAGVE